MYEDHYGLSGRPFQLTPDPRFWFDTATHKKAMAYLGYGLAQGEGFIVVTGDIGAGKTTLVGHLVETIDADRLNVIKIVSTQIAADDLLRTVCAGLDVDAAGLTKAGMLAAIERGLHVVARGGRRTLLVVDEAQALPVDSLEELRMLSNFQAGGGALMQIFLLGQPEFREKLADAALEQLRQRVIAMHHLGPMEADELAPYLIHRLSVVGWSGRPDFAESAIDAIYAWSGGIPRRINQLVSRVLLHGAIEGIDAFKASDVATVVGDMAGDGMRGGDLPDVQPEPDLGFAEEPASLPAVEAAAETPAVMEWPFIERDAVEADAGTWRPIAIEPVDPIEASTPIESESEDIAPTIAAAAPESDPLPTEVVDAEGEPAIVEVAEGDDEPAKIDVAETTTDPIIADDIVTDTVPVAITAPPRLFERFSFTARKSILAPVDAAPAPVEPEVAAEPAPAPAIVVDLDVARRLAEIDKRLEEQDAALRRVLTLLVDWVEGGARADAAGLRDRAG